MVNIVAPGMAEGEDWSRLEVEAAVSAYAEMLRLELAGMPFNKAERNRALQQITKRSKGSIERKHQNISAILNEAGIPYVVGYKPLGNYQGLLGELVTELLIEDPQINAFTAEVVCRKDFSPVVPKDLMKIKVKLPQSRKSHPSLKVSESRQLFVKKNYLEAEARNSALGIAGEKLVLKYEHERLRRAGKKELAERIEHVSEEKGDYLGYDILSFEENGKERLIEVKTTQFGQMTPFFVSRNEVEKSIELSEYYQVYRIFSFERNTKLFTLEGAIGGSCELTAVSFSAVPNIPVAKGKRC